MRLPSRKVLKRTAAVTAMAALISISISTGIRLLLGVESDNVTIVVRLALPFLIAPPIAFVWFTKLERLERAYRILARQANDLARSASTDPLTGLFNRRHFIAQFDQAMEIGVPGWFLIADIDYMKIINDRYGHLAGDEAVLATAKALETLLPEDSLIARIGGDEFCALIHGFQEKDMHLLSEQINTLAEQLFKYATKAESATLAVSMGYIACKPQQTFKDVMGQADKKLYRKKRMRSYHREAVN